jgi:hypothetical protein
LKTSVFKKPERWIWVRAMDVDDKDLDRENVLSNSERLHLINQIQ